MAARAAVGAGGNLGGLGGGDHPLKLSPSPAVPGGGDPQPGRLRCHRSASAQSLGAAVGQLCPIPPHHCPGETKLDLVEPTAQGWSDCCLEGCGNAGNQQGLGRGLGVDHTLEPGFPGGHFVDLIEHQQRRRRISRLTQQHRPVHRHIPVEVLGPLKALPQLPGQGRFTHLAGAGQHHGLAGQIPQQLGL